MTCQYTHVVFMICQTIMWRKFIWYSKSFDYENSEVFIERYENISELPSNTLSCIGVWVQQYVCPPFCKGRQFIRFPICLPGQQSHSKKRATLKGKEFAPEGANSFLKELTHNEKDKQSCFP